MKRQESATSALDQAFVVHRTFDDVDELTEMARAWDLDFRLLSRGGFSGGLIQAGTRELQVARVRLHGLIHQRGSSPPGLFTIALPRAGHIDLSWRGQSVGADDIMVYGRSGEVECTSRTDFDVFVVSVPLEALLTAFRRQDRGLPEKAVLNLEIVPTPHKEILYLRRWMMRSLVSITQELAPIGRPTWVREAEKEACDLIARCLAPSLDSDRKSHSSRTRRLVDDAINLARQGAQKIRSVKELSRETGASARTLRRGFQERFGVSPKDYLQAQRLIGVRRELRSACEPTLVRDAARRWGFSHMGQLAAEYRRHFGELPSETLRRKYVR